MTRIKKVIATRPGACEGQLFPIEETGGIALEDVYNAFYECVCGKRSTLDALAFEYDYERQCHQLWQEYHLGTYRPSLYIVFVSSFPVRREIFGSYFRDRVTDTLLARRLLPCMEARFITDNYSTRVGKGTLYGIRRVAQMIRECSAGYTRDCYVLKLDIWSFFMSIPKQQLFTDLSAFLHEHYQGNDLPLVLSLLRSIIFDRPELHCVRKSKREKWASLPPHKSMFNGDGTCGLPIGKVIVQLMALFYLDELDHLIGKAWMVDCYGRYVDDMVLIHHDAHHLLQVKDQIAGWLQTKGLRLHPNKVYLQHYSKGVLFVGGMIKPGRVYLSKRTVGNIFTRLEAFNRKAKATSHYVFSHATHFQSVMNSYLGLLSHFAEWNTTHRIIHSIDPLWFQVVYVVGKGGHYKVVLRPQYRPQIVYARKLEEEMKDCFN